MKAFKLTFLVVDLEDQGLQNVLIEFDNMKHVHSSLLDSCEFDIGEWTDDHPLNQHDEQKKYIERLEKMKKKIHEDIAFHRSFIKKQEEFDDLAALQDPDRVPSLHEHLFSAEEKPKEDG